MLPSRAGSLAPPAFPTPSTLRKSLVTSTTLHNSASSPPTLHKSVFTTSKLHNSVVTLQPGPTQQLSATLQDSAPDVYKLLCNTPSYLSDEGDGNKHLARVEVTETWEIFSLRTTESTHHPFVKGWWSQCELKWKGG